MRKHRKLGLKKVTLRDLDESSLGQVAGGTYTGYPTQCDPASGCATCAYNCTVGKNCGFTVYTYCSKTCGARCGVTFGYTCGC